jgi:hypothetical protein
MKRVYIFCLMIADVVYKAFEPWSFDRMTLVRELRVLQRYLGLYKQWCTNGPSRRRMPYISSLARELKEQTRRRLSQAPHYSISQS